MYKNSVFQWTFGKYRHENYLTDAGLSLSTGDANVGTLEIGQPVMDNGDGTIAIADGMFKGMLIEQISDKGAADDDNFRDFLLRDKLPGYGEIAKKRGGATGVLVPHSGDKAIFEGLGAAAIGNFIDTTTVTYLLANTTPKDTELTLDTGSWRIAAPGEWVFAKVVDSSLTPNTVSNVRIEVEFLSPYLKYTP